MPNSQRAGAVRRCLAAACLVVGISAGPIVAETDKPTGKPEILPSVGGWQTEITPVEADVRTTAAPHIETRPSHKAKPITKRRRATNPLTGDHHALDGIASFYWQDQMTASGETFDKNALTAAHRTLPFGTRVRVTRVDTGQSVVVRINDRGPFKKGRVIDLSKRAAEVIAMTARGLVPVKLDVVSAR